MGCQELAPVPSRVGLALQYRKDRLTSPLTSTTVMNACTWVLTKNRREKKITSLEIGPHSGVTVVVVQLGDQRWRTCSSQSFIQPLKARACMQQCIFLKISACQLLQRHQEWEMAWNFGHQSHTRLQPQCKTQKKCWPHRPKVFSKTDSESILTWQRDQPWSRRWFPQGEAAPLHSGVVDPCDFTKCVKLGCVIFVSGDLRSR